MNKKIISIFILALLFGTLFFPCSKAPIISENKKILRSINALNGNSLFDRYIEILMKLAHKPSISASIIKNDKVVFAKGYGLYDIEKNKIAQSDTIYLSASISKTVTATALMQLIENESYSIDLDDDVNNYLPFSLRNPNHPNKPITIRMLLSHRSSLAGDNTFWVCLSYVPGDPDIPDYPHPWLENYLKPNGSAYTPNIWSESLPGENYAYTNVGFSIVGYLVELISGERFDLYCKNHIFEPLQMHNTSFRLRDVNISNLARPYEYKKGSYTPHPHYNMLVTYPAGSLRTNVEDLSHFLIAHMNRGVWNGIRILNNETVELMHKDHYDSSNERYGFGWIIGKSMFGKKEIGHSGGWPGVHTLMKFRPDEKVGVILFTNSMSPTFDISRIEGLAFQIMFKSFFIRVKNY